MAKESYHHTFQHYKKNHPARGRIVKPSKLNTQVKLVLYFFFNEQFNIVVYQQLKKQIPVYFKINIAFYSFLV
jgi:hypothetical protein